MIYSSLTSNKDSMDDKADYVEVEVACREVFRALERPINGKKWDDFSPSTREVIERVIE